MIKSSVIDKSLIKKRNNYISIFKISVLFSIAVFVFSPLLALAYVLLFCCANFFTNYVLYKRKSKFNCIKCGLCCALKVEPPEKEIRKIEKSLGESRALFMEGKYLKRVNGYCIFLKKEGEDKICSIYKFRPTICKAWPFRSFRWKWIAICPSLRALFKKQPPPTNQPI